jgi:hypothetical protein
MMSIIITREGNEAASLSHAKIIAADIARITHTHGQGGLQLNGTTFHVCPPTYTHLIISSASVESRACLPGHVACF